MSGTSGSTGGLQRATWRLSSFQVRLAGFALAVLAVAFLIVRIDTNIWREQVQLKQNFATIRAARFYFGVNFRVSLRKLNATLLDFHLSGNPADLETFRREAQELQAWLQTKEASFVAPDERDAFRGLEKAYREFLTRVDPPQKANGALTARREDFATAYAQVRQDARPVLNACDDVAQAEHDGFDIFLQNSDRTLVSLQRLFRLSLLLLMALAAALAVLVYRGMISPLRAKLGESQLLLQRQEKLASLGVLGAGVAHEIRNPLTAIKFRLFSLKNSLPPECADNEDARVISEEIDRLDRIVKDFLQFARPSEPELVRLPAERLLQEVYDLLKAQLAEKSIQLKLEILQAVWIQADPQQIKQVLINLIQNSAESIRTRGAITLRLRQATAELGGRTRPAAILEVTDTGQGIPPEVQKRLFDPFFTTKAAGTGLGLPIAARIVEKHGGLLRYRTEFNRGTTFEIVLTKLATDAT